VMDFPSQIQCVQKRCIHALACFWLTVALA
jgi:hypothetical protein